jgi:flagellar basal-body rod protein FlgC
MDYAQVFAISAAGMELERTRVEVTALNLANANTVQSAGGQTYQPMRVVARSSVIGSPDSFENLMDQGLMAAGPTANVVPTLAQPRLVYEPDHPDANDKGFVTYPGVDTATEMVTLMGATRAYEANVVAMNAARSMALKALDIGGAS